MDADWTDEAVWRAANPSLGETASIDFYREQCARAQAMPTEQNSFRTLLLSQWVGQAERYLHDGRVGSVLRRCRTSAARRSAAWTCPPRRI